MKVKGIESSRHTVQAARIEGDLNAIRRAVHRPIEAEITRSPLTAPQIAVMRIVVRENGISIKDLSHEMGLAHSTVSGILDRLERHGLIERKQDPSDGRIARIHPADEVSAFVRDKLPALRRGPLLEALVKAKRDEGEQIARAIRRLRELLENTDSLSKH